jgi:V/A-type H+-transporting ATPase subunit I
VLGNLVEWRRPLIKDSLGNYLIQLPIEAFEILISLFSNTLSYVRMGAFAVAHGALSQVVTGLAGEPGGLGYWAVIVGGNLFIIGFEGMIVGIQTLRLEYYEFFSKFFSGGGVTYHPLMLIPRE